MIFLLHPGPSVLVTAIFVAAAGLAGREVPGPLRVLQLAGAMLPVQFAIGTVNDVADLPADSIAKPHKPLVHDALSRRGATLLGVGLAGCGLAVAASINLTTLGLFAAGLGAGIAYDVGLRRTPLSWVPWWGGFAVLPLAAYASIGRIPNRLWVVVPLAALFAIGLHLANAAPDLDADREAGHASLPLLLGAEWTRRLAPLTIAAAGGAALALAEPFGQAAPWLIGASLLLGLALAGVVVARPRRTFPALAITTGIFVVAWLATLPAG